MSLCTGLGIYKAKRFGSVGLILRIMKIMKEVIYSKSENSLYTGSGIHKTVKRQRSLAVLRKVIIKYKIYHRNST